MANCSHCGSLQLEGCHARCPGCGELVCNCCAVDPPEPCCDEVRERQFIDMMDNDDFEEDD